VAALCAVVLSFVLAGCGKQPIAIVGQKKITRDEFVQKMEQEVGREVLVNMIDRQLIEEAATAAGINVTPQEVQDEINKAKEQSGSPEKFAQFLASQNMTEQDAADRVTYTLKVKALLTKDVKVNDAELKKFFDQYKDQFSQPELISYSEIVTATRQEADKVVAELAKPGADFATLAKQHSISSLSRDRGGQVQPVAREQIYPPAIRTAVLALKKGGVSAPVEADKRFYVLKLDNIKAAKKADLTADRKQIEEVFKMRQAKDYQALLQELRQKATINVVDPKYADVNDQFKPKPEVPQFGAESGKGGPAGTAIPPPAGAGQAPPAGAQAPPAAGQGK
jgi:foldase protein PrsA